MAKKHPVPLSPLSSKFLPDRPKELARHCAYCRKSDWKPAGYSCRLGKTMDASTCADFRDSRLPATAPPDFLK